MKHYLILPLFESIGYTNAFQLKMLPEDTDSYSDFSKETNEKKVLDRILVEAHKDGLRSITDQDARPEGGAQALAHFWDNGKSASTE